MFITRLKKFLLPCEANAYRPKILAGHILIYYVIGLLIIKLALIYFLIGFPRSAFFADVSKMTLIGLTNKERLSSGLGILRENPQLNWAAYLKAQDMLAKNYFSHQSPSGITPWYWFKAAGYTYRSAGENLGIGFIDSEEIYQAWRNSLSHKVNLLNPTFRDIGIAVVKGKFNGSEATVVVQLFGSQKAVAQAKAQSSVATGKVIPSLVSDKLIAQETSQKKVLAATSENEQIEGIGNGNTPTLSEKVFESTENPFVLSFLRFMTGEANIWLGFIVFLSLMIIVILATLNILIKFEVQHQDLIFKTMFLICLLVIFILFNREELIALVPHNLIIY